jgi:hypothetical protein
MLRIYALKLQIVSKKEEDNDQDTVFQSMSGSECVKEVSFVWLTAYIMK